MGDHHDPVSGGNSQKSDESHQRGHRQNTVGQEDGRYGSDETQRQGEHDLQSKAHPLKMGIEENKDGSDGNNGQQQD